MNEECDELNNLDIKEYRIKHLSFFLKNKYKTLLDISCGDCKYLKYWKWKGFDVSGTEYDEIKIQNCKNFNIPCEKLDLNNKNLKINREDNSVNVVTCTEVLEHITEPKKVVSEMIRVASDVVLITTPVFKSFWSDEHINIWETASKLINEIIDEKHKDEIEIICDVIVTKPEDWALNQRSFILALYKK